jgi:hypothetical protein
VAAGVRTGRVVAWDEAAGYGEVEDAAGRRVPFHCTAVADGRTIAVGVPVRFTVVPGHLGRWEAAGVTPGS